MQWKQYFQQGRVSEVGTADITIEFTQGFSIEARLQYCRKSLSSSLIQKQVHERWKWCLGMNLFLHFLPDFTNFSPFGKPKEVSYTCYRPVLIRYLFGNFISKDGLFRAVLVIYAPFEFLWYSKRRGEPFKISFYSTHAHKVSEEWQVAGACILRFFHRYRFSEKAPIYTLKSLLRKSWLVATFVGGRPCWNSLGQRGRHVGQKRK